MAEGIKAAFYDRFGCELRVSGIFHPGRKGGRGEHGAPTEPDDPATVEVVSVTDEDDAEVPITEGIREAAIEALWESLSRNGTSWADSPIHEEILEAGLY